MFEFMTHTDEMVLMGIRAIRHTRTPDNAGLRGEAGSRILLERAIRLFRLAAGHSPLAQQWLTACCYEGLVSEFALNELCRQVPVHITSAVRLLTMPRHDCVHTHC
jgi:hypothetical protein